MGRTRPARPPRRSRLRRATCAALALLPAIAGPGWAATYVDKRTAELQGLDKITARTWTLDAPVGQPVRFGTLEIRVEACKKRPPEEPPENAAFMTIVDHRPDQHPVEVFRGWMFASRPGLSPLEHPVYDIVVLECE